MFSAFCGFDQLKFANYNLKPESKCKLLQKDMIVKVRFCKITKKIQNTVLKDKKLSKPGSTYMERSLLTLVNHELTVIKPISARLLNQKTLNQQHMPS